FIIPFVAGFPSPPISDRQSVPAEEDEASLEKEQGGADIFNLIQSSQRSGKQAKEFLPFIKPSAVMYNTSGRYEGAFLIFNLMQRKRVDPDAYLITGNCNEGKLDALLLSCLIK
ncbi:hypothetical protein LINGRAHAP2_LOCUS21986, partial [Linum grandiflorum]